MRKLYEDSRAKLLTKSRQGQNYKDQSKGKNRYERRVHSKIANSVKEYNQLDMNKLFKDSILDVSIRVHGETDDYIVRIKFGDFLDKIHEQLKSNNGKFELKIIIRALTKCFSDLSNNIFVHCSCQDFEFRFKFWATINGFNSGEPQLSNGKEIRNPDDKLGPACKHVILTLSNTSWIIKVASVINNYVKYMERTKPKLYADIIYPAIYEKEYEEPVQLSFDDTEDDLTTSSDELDIANAVGAKSGQFQKGNTMGVRFAKQNTPIKGQEEITDNSDDEVSDYMLNR